MSYIPSGDIATFLVEEGIIPAPDYFTSSRLATLLDNAITRWEDLTGYVPFLAVAGTRYFDPPDGCILSLNTGLVTFTSLTIAGVAYTNATHFYLKQTISQDQDYPYDTVEFTFPVYGVPATIAITGSFGFTATISAEVNECIKRLAAMEALTTIAGVNGEIVELAQDDMRVRYAGYTQTSKAKTKRELYEDFVKSKLDKYSNQMVIANG